MRKADCAFCTIGNPQQKGKERKGRKWWSVRESNPLRTFPAGSYSLLRPLLTRATHTPYSSRLSAHLNRISAAALSICCSPSVSVITVLLTIFILFSPFVSFCIDYITGFLTCQVFLCGAVDYSTSPRRASTMFTIVGSIVSPICQPLRTLLLSSMRMKLSPSEW